MHPQVRQSPHMIPRLPRLAWLLLALWTPVPTVRAAEIERTAHYVQLIRGDDEDKPPGPDAKVVGTRLSTRLRPLFRWKSYWEIQHQRVDVSPGGKTKVKLNREREVEIDLTEPGKRKVTVSQSGKELARSIRKAGEAMTIIGGERDARSVWFVVVRVDKPTP